MEGKGKETEELVQLYEKLQQEWHTMKNQQRSNSRTASRRRHTSHQYHSRAPNSNSGAAATEESESWQQKQERCYCYSSPRDMMKELQREKNNTPPSSGEGEEFSDALRERVKAIESGKLKVRRLLFYDPVDEIGAESAANANAAAAEVRSISYDSDDEREDGDGSSRGSSGTEKDRCYWCPPSSPNTVFAVIEMRVADDDDDDAVNKVETKGSRFGGFLRWLAFAFVLIAMCISLAMSFGGHEDDSQVFLVPT